MEPKSPSPSRRDASILARSKTPSSNSLDGETAASSPSSYLFGIQEDSDLSEHEVGALLDELSTTDLESDNDDDGLEEPNIGRGDEKANDNMAIEVEVKEDGTGGYDPVNNLAFHQYGFMDLEELDEVQGGSQEEGEAEVKPTYADAESDAQVPVAPPRATRTDSSSPVKDTPVARTQHGQKCPSDLNKRYILSANEAARHLIGPMPVDTFLKEFLPIPATDKSMPKSKGAFNGVPRNPQNEAQIYTPLIVSINENGRCPNVTFVGTSVASDHSRGVCKPSMTGYESRTIEQLVDQGKADCEPPESPTTEQRAPKATDTTSQTTNDSTKPMRCNANLGLADIYWEIKMRRHDPFCDKHEHELGKRNSFLSWDNKAVFDSSRAFICRKTFGQMAVYAAEACARQHRIFYFSVLIAGTYARFFRWDRAGVIVTEAFNYREKPKVLCDFLWRFGNANPIQRGFDPTVTVASEAERKLFADVISKEVAFQLWIASDESEKLQKHLQLHYEKGKVTKILVHDRDSSEWEEYLVSVPITSPTSFVGRSTRAYWSVRMGRDKSGEMTGKAAFLKDVWRADVPNSEDEGTIYQHLMKGNVRKIPGVIAFGDVLEDPNLTNAEENEAKQAESEYKHQSTRTQDFRGAAWCRSCLPENNDGKRIVTHRHYRLTLDEVGYSLKNFENSRELFRAGEDAFEALDSAFEKCKRMHRDVSMDNIILVRNKVTGEREGRLVDWEFSTLVDRSGKARDDSRSGTWVFMAAEALHDEIPDFRHSDGHDLESLFYVMMYCSLLWLRHNVIENFGRWMYKFFDDATVINGRDFGGHEKFFYITLPEAFTTKFEFDEPIHTWFKSLYQDLGSTALNLIEAGFPLKWTRENFGQKMAEVNRGLVHVKGSDRVEHDVAAYYFPIPEVFRATHTSVRHSASVRAAIPVAEASGYSVSERRKNKRPRVDVDQAERKTDAEGSRKRRKRC